MPLAIRSGISIKEAYHYTLHDLSQEIVYRQERDRKMAWENGARVMEAIGVAFSKNKKYSEVPIVKTKDELQEENEAKFMNFVKSLSHVKFTQIKDKK